jgi:hypothetical protein
MQTHSKWNANALHMHSKCIKGDGMDIVHVALPAAIRVWRNKLTVDFSHDMEDLSAFVERSTRHDIVHGIKFHNFNTFPSTKETRIACTMRLNALNIYAFPSMRAYLDFVKEQPGGFTLLQDMLIGFLKAA